MDADRVEKRLKLLVPDDLPRATQNVAAAQAELDRSTWTPLVAVPSVWSRTLMRAEYKSLPCQFEPWLELIAVDPARHTLVIIVGQMEVGGGDRCEAPSVAHAFRM
ncbi:MAG: hypothetical protein U0270_40780 [Labilithrix sp.]